MADKKWDFDREAAFWDLDPGRVSLAEDIARAISDQGVLTPDMDLLEFGCGTGLLTLRLQPLVRSVVCVDSSMGMLGILKEKIENRSLTNITAQLMDPTKGEVLQGSYHLVVSSMTLHHVREIRPLIDQFYRIAAPRGYLCIADLDPDGGEFHGDNDTVFHCGFDRGQMRRTLMEAGFGDIRDTTAANVMKRVPSGGKKVFSVFLMIGRKGWDAGDSL
ncbi:MAG TPA: class I SAM-dependent methyltransferase [Syntrophobacteraceae bacterium]|nr:class I SAM-dependent methyltransferase [Syntrophobacteraceae bacterium]